MTLLERFTTWIGLPSRAPADCIGCGPRASATGTPMYAGRELGICRECASEAATLVGRTGPGTAFPDNDNVSRCHFCGTDRASASGLVGWPRGAICRKCLELARGELS